jgi:hypothetical protein
MRITASSTSRSYRCSECDAVLANAENGGDITESLVGQSGGPTRRVVRVDGVEIHRCLAPFLMLSGPSTVSAVAEWDRISTARSLVAEELRCSADEALRAMKERSDEIGHSIGAVSDGLIDGTPFAS